MTQRNPDARVSRKQRYPLLDPLRGLAAIAILLVHTATFGDALDDPVYGRLFAHLDIGVPFFFVLSAFLLYRPFVDARENGTSRTRFAAYGKRRFARIAPAYWTVLTVTAIVPGMAGAFTGNWWVYYGLLQSFPVYDATGTCAVDPFHCGVPVAWTLTIEVLFYMMLPLYVVVMAWLGRHWRASLLSRELCGAAVLSGLSVVIQSSIPTSDLHVWLFFSPIGRGWWFALGLGLAAISVHLDRRPIANSFMNGMRRMPGVPVCTGLLLYVGAAMTFLEPGPSLNYPTTTIDRYVAQYLLFGMIAALFILPAVFGADGGGVFRRTLRHRSLNWLGKVSYGVFLWHYAAMILLLDAGIRGFIPLTLFTLAITVPCAAASFYVVERPLMRRARSATAVEAPRRPPRPVESRKTPHDDIGAPTDSSRSATSTPLDGA